MTTPQKPGLTALDRLIAQAQADMQASLELFAKADGNLDDDFADLDEATDASEAAQAEQDSADQAQEGANAKGKATSPAEAQAQPENAGAETPTEPEADEGEGEEPEEGALPAKPTLFVKADGGEFIPFDATPLLERIAESYESMLAEVQTLRKRGDQTTKRLGVIAKAVETGVDGMLTLANAAQGNADQPLAPRHLRTANVPTRVTVPEVDASTVFAKAEAAVERGELAVEDFILLNNAVNALGAQGALQQYPAICQTIT